MLTVFLTPIAFACIHLAVILPVINKLLMFFGLFYAVIYKVTSNVYVKIVTSM